MRTVAAEQDHTPVSVGEAVVYESLHALTQVAGYLGFRLPTVAEYCGDLGGSFGG